MGTLAKTQVFWYLRDKVIGFRARAIRNDRLPLPESSKRQELFPPAGRNWVRQRKERNFLGACQLVDDVRPGVRRKEVLMRQWRAPWESWQASWLQVVQRLRGRRRPLRGRGWDRPAPCLASSCRPTLPLAPWWTAATPAWWRGRTEGTSRCRRATFTGNARVSENSSTLSSCAILRGTSLLAFPPPSGQRRKVAVCPSLGLGRGSARARWWRSRKGANGRGLSAHRELSPEAF